jgi:hypothetical protein
MKIFFNEMDGGVNAADRCVIFRFTIYNPGPGSETTPRTISLHFALGVTGEDILTKHFIVAFAGQPPLGVFIFMSYGHCFWASVPPRSGCRQERTSDRLSFDMTASKPTPSEIMEARRNQKWNHMRTSSTLVSY